MQINNIKIRYSKMNRRWQVQAPDGRVLEQFILKLDAIKFAKDTKDFLSTN